jgi:OOP family OmpA-OmpF porin
MMSKRTGLAVGLGLALSLASASSWAEGSGWYFGVTGGQAKADISREEIDDQVLAAFAAAGAIVTSGSSTLDDSDSSFSLFGGYRFSENFALEAGYVDFGAAKYRGSGIVDPIGAQPPFAVTFAEDMELTGFTAAAVSVVPVSAAFDLHARLGVLFAQTDASVAISTGSLTASESVSVDSQELFFGLGVGLQVGPNWSVSLDWQQFRDVGDDDETGESDVNRLSLGVIYKL